MEEILISKKIIDEFIRAIGKEKVFLDKPTRMCYSITHGPECILHENYFEKFLPDVVLIPFCTEDVKSIIMIANRYKVPIIPSGGRSGSYGAEGTPGSIVLDMCKMNRILDFNEKNYRITGEAGVRMKDLISYLKEKGYMATDWPASDEIATLGSRAAVNGYSWWDNRWGSAGTTIQGIEVVLPDGNVLQLARGSNIPTKSSVGWNLMDLFIGSKGTLGVVTKVTEKFTDYPSKAVNGESAFHTYEEAIKAYLELKKSKYSNTIWRLMCSVKEPNMFPLMTGKSWPKEIAMMLRYDIFGEPSEVNAMEKRVHEVFEENNGFRRPEVSEYVSWWDSRADQRNNINKSVAHYGTVNSLLAFSSHVFGGRINTNDYSAKPVYIDPNIPDDNLLDYYYEMRKNLDKIEDGKTYPNLAKCVKVYDPGAFIPGATGYNKMWIAMHVYRKNLNKKSREEFIDWFKKHAEIVWKFGGVLSSTHAWIPRELEPKFMEKTMGKNEYEFMKRVKKFIDPNNIMNPKIIF